VLKSNVSASSTPRGHDVNLFFLFVSIPSSIPPPPTPNRVRNCRHTRGSTFFFFLDLATRTFDATGSRGILSSHDDSNDETSSYLGPDLFFFCVRPRGKRLASRFEKRVRADMTYFFFSASIPSPPPPALLLSSRRREVPFVRYGSIFLNSKIRFLSNQSGLLATVHAEERACCRTCRGATRRKFSFHPCKLSRLVHAAPLCFSVLSPLQRDGSSSMTPGIFPTR